MPNKNLTHEEKLQLIDLCDHLERYLQFVGGNETEKGNPHPQQGLLDKLHACQEMLDNKE